MFDIRFRPLLCAVAASLTIGAASADVARAQAPALSAAERAEVVAYPLSMENIKRIIAAQTALASLPAATRAKMMAMTAKSSLEQQKELEGSPELVAALRGSGMTVHQFSVAGRAFADARTIVAYRASGRPIPAARLAAFPASDAQVAFVAAHKAEIDPLMKELTARMMKQ